jgi:hypothetical protein
MKKLLAVVPCILFFQFSGLAQWTCADTVIRDTIHYYYNKYHFKTGTPVTSFPRYKSIAATNTAVTYVGNKFENSEALDVIGLEGFFFSHTPRATPSNTTFTARLYLCDLDANGKPKLPPIDSVSVGLPIPPPNTTNYISTPIGGDFPGGPRRVNGNYAVLFRNMSTRQGDTALVLRTNCFTSTTSGIPQSQKCSDGYGFAKQLNTFNATTNFTALGFGFATDFEFMLAPRVQYTLHAGHTPPPDTLFCTWQSEQFTNNGSSRINERFYNLIEFKTAWNHNPAFNFNVVQQYSLPDDVRGVTWHFYSEDDKNFNLQANSNTLIFYTDSAWKSQIDPENDSVACFIGNWYAANLYGMGMDGGKLKFHCQQFFNYCTMFCNGDNVGLAKNGLLHLQAFPNPTTGSIRLKGIRGTATAEIYDITGSLIRSATMEGEGSLDIGALPAGTYLLRVTNGASTKSLKVTKMN